MSVPHNDEQVAGSALQHNQRKIIHIDMDAFYASVEQRDRPELAGQPVIVGGAPGSRGVVAACSYEARRFGVHSAMPSTTAQRLCPEAIFVRPRFDCYREVSQQIQAIFRDFTPLVEPLSLDEAFLDVSDSERWSGSATLLAGEIKSRIKMATALTASAGVSYNKFLAKIASDVNKPDGLFTITPEQGEAFIERLPIGRFFGVGRATEAKMHRLGIHNGAELKHRSREELVGEFGKFGNFFYNIARGIDERPVCASRTRKSISSETTFAEDLVDADAMLQALLQQAERVTGILQSKRLVAQTLTIKVKYADFTQVTRSKTLPHSFQQVHQLPEYIKALLAQTLNGRAVRLLGIGVSGLEGNQPETARQDAQFSLL